MPWCPVTAQSTRAPEAFTTSAHLAISRRMKSFASAGELRGKQIKDRIAAALAQPADYLADPYFGEFAQQLLDAANFVRNLLSSTKIKVVYRYQRTISC